jgi:hypothetical protein
VVACINNEVSSFASATQQHAWAVEGCWKREYSRYLGKTSRTRSRKEPKPDSGKVVVTGSRKKREPICWCRQSQASTGEVTPIPGSHIQTIGIATRLRQSQGLAGTRFEIGTGKGGCRSPLQLLCPACSRGVIVGLARLKSNKTAYASTGWLLLLVPRVRLTFRAVVF